MQGSIDPGKLRFRPRVVGGVVKVWKGFQSAEEALSSLGPAGPRRFPDRQLSPRAGSMSPSQSAIRQWGWGFHTVRGGIGPGDLRFCPWVVRVVKVCWEFSSEDGNLSSLRAAGRRRWPEGQLSPRTGSIPRQSAITQWGWGFHTLRGGTDLGDLCFLPRVVGVVEAWREFSSGDKT